MRRETREGVTGYRFGTLDPDALDALDALVTTLMGTGDVSAGGQTRAAAGRRLRGRTLLRFAQRNTDAARGISLRT